MRSNKLRRIIFCGLVVLVLFMLVTPGLPSVAAKAKPGPNPPIKKYQYQIDLKNAKDHQKEALEKIKHDLRLLEVGIVLDDMQMKLDARRSIMEAASMLDEAIADLENAQDSALNELDKDKKLAKLLTRIDISISIVKRMKVSCLQVIPLIDQIIRLEEEMDQYPPELREQMKQMELALLGQIKSTIGTK